MNHSILCAAMTAPTVLVTCVAVLLIEGCFDAVDAARMRLRYGQYDALSIARCEARCWRNKIPCVKSCLLKGFEKPGRCPVEGVLSPFAAICVDTCRQDSQCPALNKCCRHSCGITCQHPDDLETAVEVPNIPKDLKVQQGNKKRTVYIEWRPGESQERSIKTRIILYLIEERHHAGRNFIEKRLSEWMACARVTDNNFTLKNFVKPGRWYQFRVAAVNENGTKGFSEISPTFRAPISPKPPKAPKNVSVGPLWIQNGTLYTELRWSPPNSDLPIQKYKVFWSKRLRGATVLDSVLVHQQVVPKEQTKFLLQNLQPDSLYFLQVQALVQYGKDRLRGEKAALVLNTTNYTNVTDYDIVINPNSRNRIEGLSLQKLFWSQDDLRASISWKPRKGSVRYTVSWWTGPCQRNSKSYTYFKLAITTKESHFNLYDLQFECRYRVSVREVSNKGMKSMQDTQIIITTPNCEDFKAKNNYKDISCIQN